jgi:hypothetical protein
MSLLSKKSYPTPSPDVIDRITDGEVVLVIPDKGTVKVLNEVGTSIWQLINGKRSIQEIANDLCKIYNVDPADAEMDTIEFIIELVSRDIVSISS